MSDLVEKVARAVMVADDLVFDEPEKAIKIYEPMAQVAIAVVLKEVDRMENSHQSIQGIAKWIARENGVSLDG